MSIRKSLHGVYLGFLLLIAGCGDFKPEAGSSGGPAPAAGASGLKPGGGGLPQSFDLGNGKYN